jgi:hypothetical protein
MVHSERRQHRRYVVEGKAIISSPSGELRAQLVDVGKGGVLVLAQSGAVTVGEQIDVRFTIEGYPVELQASGRVARTDTHAIGIAFAEVPTEFDEAILWLEAGFIATMF